MSEPIKGRRNPAKNRPWKHIYGVDRKYTARVDRLMSRLLPVQYNPSTPPYVWDESRAISLDVLKREVERLREAR